MQKADSALSEVACTSTGRELNRMFASEH